MRELKMKRSTSTLFSVISFWLIFSFSLSGQTTDHGYFSRQVDSLFKERITQSTPGAAVVVTEKGKPIFKECYGLANVEHNIPITSTTVFNLASVSKQFTAFAILLLEKEGEINLNDDIHTYFPELPNYKTITVRNLLHQTSGIWGWGGINLYAGNNRYDNYTLDEVMKLLKKQEKPLFEPGSQYSYCNTNYILLAQIVARISGEPFSSWTRKNMFEPLGMKRSCFKEDSFQLFKEMASPYRKDNKGILVDGRPNRSNFSGDGDVFTTIDDMVLLMDNFRTKKLGGNEVVDKMFQKGRLNNGGESSYGYGLEMLMRHGKKVIRHTGTAGGYRAVMLYCPENEVGITILANERSFSVAGMANRIFDLYLGIEPDEKEKTQPDKTSYFIIDSSRVEDYIGAYLLEGSSSRLVFCYLGENKFYGIFEGLGQDYFRPISATEFIIPDENVTVFFIPDKNKQMSRIKLDLEGNIMWGNRIEFERLSPSQLSLNYSGAYYSHVLATVFEISVDGDQLVMCHRRAADREFAQVDKDEFALSYGIMRFKRDEQGRIMGFDILDQHFNYNPIHFKKIAD